MFRITILFLALSCICSSLAAAQAAKPLPRIEVTAPKDVESVEALNNALRALSEKVTECVKAGGKPEVCRCKYPQELAKFRKSYATLIQQHPEWKDKILGYEYVNKDGRNISGTMDLETMRRQLEVLKCD